MLLSIESSLVALSDTAADRVERFLEAHPSGPLVVCVGSASVAGIVWLAEHSRSRPVTLLIGDMKSRNFTKSTDADRHTALDFTRRDDVTVLNWYRTHRTSQGRSEAHLKIWAACDDAGTPHAFLVGSANLTIAGLHANVELMALADPSEHSYLHSTLQQLRDKSWDAKERLQEWIEHGGSAERQQHRRSERSRKQHPAASTGCGPQVLAVATLVAAASALLARRVRR